MYPVRYAVALRLHCYRFAFALNPRHDWIFATVLCGFSCLFRLFILAFHACDQ